MAEGEGDGKVVGGKFARRSFLARDDGLTEQAKKRPKLGSWQSRDGYKRMDFAAPRLAASSYPVYTCGEPLARKKIQLILR